jgi:hypothetical protein
MFNKCHKSNSREEKRELLGYEGNGKWMRWKGEVATQEGRIGQGESTFHAFKSDLPS